MGAKALRAADRRDPVLAGDPIFHRASASVSIGGFIELKTDTQITSGGLLAVGGLVAAILLSTAVLVRSGARGR